MPFSTSLAPLELTAYVARLLTNLIPDGRDAVPRQADVDLSLERVERCFAGIQRKYYTQNGAARFDHLNGDHLATFLYFLGNTIFTREGDIDVATKTFAANKALHGLDLFYAVRMPDVFLLAHPVGTVIGNAEYEDELHVTQNCTIGNDGGRYPRLGRGVVLYAGATVLGDSVVGDDVVFAAGSFVLNTEIPAHSLVAGRYPDHRILPNPVPVHDRIFAAG